MIIKKVKLAFVGILDLIYIHKPYPFSHTGLHSHSPPPPPKKKNQPHTPTHGLTIFFGRATVSLETLVQVNNLLKKHNNLKKQREFQETKRLYH